MDRDSYPQDMDGQRVMRVLVGRTIAEVERGLILETLKYCCGNRTQASHILGLSIRTLRNKLNKYVADGVLIPPPACGVASYARQDAAAEIRLDE